MDAQAIYEAARMGRAHRVQQLISEALDAGADPTALLDALIPAIDEVGQRYRQYDVDIATLLNVARSVQKGMDVLSEAMRGARQCVGRVILGTVEGDLHDVGKNLVAIMLRIYGFDVIDLGVDVSGRQFVEAALQNPDVHIMCLSCLINTSMPEMRRCTRLIRSDPRLAHVRIMVGGAPINGRFAEEIGADVYTDNAVDAAKAALKMTQDACL